MNYINWLNELPLRQKRVTLWYNGANNISLYWQRTLIAETELSFKPIIGKNELTTWAGA